MQCTYIPYMDFKQPATIIDAVEFFRDASRRYDPRPKVPVKDKGISFILKLDDADAPAQTHTGFGAAYVPEEMPRVRKLTTNQIYHWSNWRRREDSPRCCGCGVCRARVRLR